MGRHKRDTILKPMFLCYMSILLWILCAYICGAIYVYVCLFVGKATKWKFNYKFVNGI
jgi:hypothetical protein